MIYPGYIDHGEPNSAMVAWRLLAGIPAYPAFEDAGRVTNVYGPISYIMLMPSYILLGPTILAGKAMGQIVAVLIPLIAFFIWRKDSITTGIAAAIMATAFILWNIPTSIWGRPDPFIVFAVILAVWISKDSQTDQPEWIKSITIAVLGGLAVSMKIHAGIYFAPIVLFFCATRGFKTFFVMCAIGSSVVMAPFAFEIFSLPNYFSWFLPVAAKSNPGGIVLKVLKYALLYTVPLFLFIFARRGMGRPEHIYFTAYVVCLALTLFPATKPGAGVHYFFPFLPVTIDLSLRMAKCAEINRRQCNIIIASITALTLILSIPIQKRFYRALHWQEAESITADIKGIISANAGLTVEMGVGDSIKNYPTTFYKGLLVLAGNPYTLDGAIITETSHLKIPLSPSTLVMIRSCRTKSWLIPKGEAPFAMIGYYGNRAFSNNFREAFLESYEKRNSSTYFDIWVCKKRS